MDTSGAPPPQDPPRRIMAPAPRGNGACTHMSMTRLYTDTLRCTNCKQISSYGWLLKCTQDSELTFEDELQRGVRTSQLDQFCDIFEPPTTPKKRGPAARTASRLSFLDEITDEALRTYTPEQLKRVLDQRANCRMVAQAAAEEAAGDSGLQILFTDNGPSRYSSRWSDTSTAGLEKPWLSSKECAYKICFRCRHSYMDRTWLSMDGVANGELPYTSVVGHGFHYRLGKQRRPVSPNSLVTNIGLKTAPLIGPGALLIVLGPQRPTIPDIETRRRQLFPHLFEDEERFEDPLPVDENIITQSGTQAPIPAPDGTISLQHMPIEARGLPMFPMMRDPIYRAQHNPQSHSRSSSCSITVPILQQNADPLTPPQSSPPSPSTPKDHFAADHGLQATPDSAPPTPIEENEEVDAFFSSAPLEVKSGVAVTEEGVELHVPDIVLEDHWAK